VEDLIKDGAKFEDILHKKYVLTNCIRLGFNQHVKDFIQHLIPFINLMNPKLSRCPLHEAARRENIEMVKLLIENGAEVNKSDENGKSALYYAIEAANHEIVDFLIEKKSDLTNALTWTLEVDQMELYSKISKIISDEIKQKNVQSALFAEVSTFCRLKRCKRVCELGANAAELDDSGYSSLFYATKAGNLKCVQYFLTFLKEKHFIDTRNSKGETILMTAIYHKHEKIIEYLLENNADVFADDKKDNTCLHLAAQSGNLECVEYFLNIGVGIELANIAGWTAISFAANSGNADVFFIFTLDVSEFCQNNQIREHMSSSCIWNK